jgi:hypothetical protein
LSQNIFGHFFFKFYMVRPFQNAQILAFWFSKWKVMTVWRYFSGQFLTQKRVNFKKLFLGNKKFGISKILTMDSYHVKAYSCKIKKKSKMTLIYFFGLEHCRKKTTGHPVNFLSQNIFGHIFFKFYIVRPFQNTQILAIWFSE